MANDKKFIVKNGLITQNIDYVSPDKTNTIEATMLDSDTLSFDGDSGQLFSITDSLTGTIFSVNDITGIPSIEVDDDGTIRFAEFAGNVLIGTDTDNGVDKLQVNGSISGDGSNLTKISVPTADAPPSNPSDGELWWDSDAGNMFIYYSDGSSNQWVPSSIGYPGPQGPQGNRGYTGSSSTTLNISSDTSTAPLYPVMVTGTGGGRNGRINAGDFLFDSSAGRLTLSRLRIKTTSKQNQIDFYTESDTGNIADTFSGTTDKSYIYFLQTNSSNDPGYIMHETRQSGERNEGVLHIVPTDDNSGTDHVSIHGTNDPDSIRLFTSGAITGVTTLSSVSINTNNLSVSNDASVSNNATVGGNLTASSITETSTITVKENLKPIIGAVDMISKLSAYTFDRIDSGRKNQSGLIAEELYDILPDLVSLDDDNNPAGVQYTSLIAYLVEGIKELKQEINSLKSKY